MNSVIVVAGVAAVSAALSGCASTSPEAGPPCDPERIERDLAVADHLVAAEPAVPECTGDWAVIRWDAPGDNQRIVRLVDATWVDYVRFPHDRCWGQAAADGVPEVFRPYFGDC